MKKSTIKHKPDHRSISPMSAIETVSGKVTCLIQDNRLYIQLMMYLIHVSIHLIVFEKKKAGKILRIHCIVQHLRIKKLEFKLSETAGRTPLINIIVDDLFCLYSEDETNVYENQYSSVF
jgi:hypothetical protein